MSHLTNALKQHLGNILSFNKYMACMTNTIMILKGFPWRTKYLLLVLYTDPCKVMEKFLSWRMIINTSSMSLCTAYVLNRKCSNMIRVENTGIKILVHAHGHYNAHASAPMWRAFIGLLKVGGGGDTETKPKHTLVQYKHIFFQWTVREGCKEEYILEQNVNWLPWFQASNEGFF